MLDTLKYAKRLQEAGFTAMQAEAQANALWEAIQGTVATKEDIALVRQEIGELRTEMDGRFSVVDARFRLVYWMLAFVLAFNAAILAKLFAG